MIKVISAGTVEERLRKLEQSVNFSEVVLPCTAGGGGDAPGSVSSGNVTPTGGLPGTSFTVPQNGGNDPVMILLVLNGLVMDQVAGAPAAADEFRLVGHTITTFRTIVSTDKFKAFLWY